MPKIPWKEYAIIGIARVYYCLQALLLFSRAIWLVYQNIPAGMKVLAYSK